MSITTAVKKLLEDRVQPTDDAVDERPQSISLVGRVTITMVNGTTSTFDIRIESPSEGDTLKTAHSLWTELYSWFMDVNRQEPYAVVAGNGVYTGAYAKSSIARIELHEDGLK